MPQVNQLARELVFKVVYYGPGLGGKTTSLQLVHATTRPEHRGKMVSLATPVDRTLYFDFLPIRVPTSRNMTIRLQLFTVPGQVYYNATRKLVLTGADGVVFVADSQVERADANDESFRNLEENLQEHGRSLDEMPHVFAYNKRDMDEVCAIDAMERQLNLRGAPSFATVATTGEGVYEALEAITRAVLEDFDQRVPEHRGLAPSPLMLPEGGLAEALRRVDPASDGSGPPLSGPPIALVSGGSGSSRKPTPAREEEFEFELSTPSHDDTGERAARAAVEPGTAPGLGFRGPRLDGGASGIADLGTAVAEPSAPGGILSQGHASGQAGDVRAGHDADERHGWGSSAPPQSMEASVQSHFRPLPVPLEGVGMRSSPPDATGADEPASGSAEVTSRNLGGFSLSLLWPVDEQVAVQRVEEAILLGDHRDALLLCEVLIERRLDVLARALGRTPLDASAVMALLELPGSTYFDFQRLLLRARETRATFTHLETARAILFATNVCLAVARASRDYVA